GLASFWIVRDLAARRRRPRFDFGGAATLGLAMVAVLFGINQAGSAGWAAPVPLGLFAGAAALLWLFVLLEARLDAPMVDLGLLRNRAFTAANLTNLLSNLTMFGVWLLVPYYLAQALDLAPVAAGLLLGC